MGDGVATFRVSLHPTAGYRSFVATRVDGTAVDFSLRKWRRRRSAWTPRGGRSRLRAHRRRIASRIRRKDARPRRAPRGRVRPHTRRGRDAQTRAVGAEGQRDREGRRDWGGTSDGAIPAGKRFGDDARWREIVEIARHMCDAGELDARAHASVVHSVAVAVDAGAVEMTSAGVYDLLTSLERKTPDALEKTRRAARGDWRGGGEFAVGVRQDRVAAVAGDVGGDRAFSRQAARAGR